jgi:outer membrane protein
MSEKKIGFVRNGKLLSDAKIMKAANEEVNKNIRQLQVNADTLKNRYEVLKTRIGSVSGSEKAVLQYQLEVAENNYKKFMQNAEAEMAEMQRKLSGEAVEKVNKVVEKFARDKGYRYILGTTNDGNILFAEDSDDLTDEILEEVNKIPSDSLSVK